MRGILPIALLVIGGVSAVVFYASVFVVYQTEQAIVLQFGDPRQVESDPGLHFKRPFIQNVVRLDKRILDLDTPEQEIIASDQKRLVVDAYARYRITRPLDFYKSVNNVRRANSRLSTIVNSSIRSVLGKEPFISVVRDHRNTLMKQIAQLVNEQAQDFGIEVVDVRLRRVDLPDANSQAVFRRMQTERQQEAAQIRAIGQEDAREIKAQADKEVSVILATARRDADVIRGQGDACRNRIFASAFGQDPDFFAFYRSMQSYERALDSSETSLVLTPKSDFFRFFVDPNARAEDDLEAIPPQEPAIDLSQGSLREQLCAAIE